MRRHRYTRTDVDAVVRSRLAQLAVFERLEVVADEWSGRLG